MLTHKQVWEAIDALAAENGFSTSGLAKKAGLDPTTFNKSKRKTNEGRLRWPSTESISKILDATGSTITDFLSLIQPRIVEMSKASGEKIRIVSLGAIKSARLFDSAGFAIGKAWSKSELPSRAASDSYMIAIDTDQYFPFINNGEQIVVSPKDIISDGDRVLFATRSGEFGLGRYTKSSPNTSSVISFDISSTEPVKPKKIKWMVRILSIH